MGISPPVTAALINSFQYSAHAAWYRKGAPMRIIDLSASIDASAWEVDGIRHEVLTPAEGARHMADGMLRNHGIEFDVSELPDGELLSLDTLTLTTHTGTHVDAPSHYGSKAGYGPPRNIDELPLDWL